MVDRFKSWLSIRGNGLSPSCSRGSASEKRSGIMVAIQLLLFQEGVWFERHEMDSQ
jgi:hypothetical protein